MKVGILGAGAIGLPLGFMLHHDGKNEITYLVRESKVETFPKSQKLFNYDKKKVFEFDSYSVGSTNLLLKTESEASAYAPIYDLVIIALPSDVLSSSIGKELVGGLRNVSNEDTSYLVLSPGYQMMENVFDPAGISKSKVSFGLPLFLSHEVAKSEDLMNEKFPLMKEADLAFHYLLSKKRILLLNKKPKTLKKTLSAARKKTIGVGTNMLDASTAMFVVLNLLLWLQDYPKGLKRNKVFTAGMKAFWQMTRQHGGSGFLLRNSMGKTMMKFVDRSNRSRSKPLTTEFLRYHHGVKVLEQNITYCKQYIDVGSSKKKKVDKIDIFVTMCTAKKSQQTLNAVNHV